MKRSIFKNVFVAVMGLAIIFSGCAGAGQKSESENCTEVVALSREEIKSLSFSELFKTVEPKEVSEPIFTLVSEDFSVLTSGNPTHYNSMIASWGGWGILFNRPVVFHMLRSNRYTLELMRKENSYTMTFFDDEFKEDIMPFGMSSGRDSDEKMKNTKLTAVQTPAGNMTYKEAKIIIECKLIQVTTVSPDDFLVEDNKKFIVDAHAETGEYHKVVYGEITNVWIRK